MVASMKGQKQMTSINFNNIEEPRKSRRYSLFEKIDGKWVRLTSTSYLKQMAVHNYQSILISGSLNGHHLELRPVKD
jgi:hypothetical protein